MYGFSGEQRPTEILSLFISSSGFLIAYLRYLNSKNENDVLLFSILIILTATIFVSEINMITNKVQGALGITLFGSAIFFSYAEGKRVVATFLVLSTCILAIGVVVDQINEMGIAEPFGRQWVVVLESSEEMIEPVGLLFLMIAPMVGADRVYSGVSMQGKKKAIVLTLGSSALSVGAAYALKPSGRTAVAGSICLSIVGVILSLYFIYMCVPPDRRGSAISSSVVLLFFFAFFAMPVMGREVGDTASLLCWSTLSAFALSSVYHQHSSTVSAIKVNEVLRRYI
jgi:hypothetical protein